MDLRIAGLRPRFLSRNDEGTDGVTTNGRLVGMNVEGRDIKVI